ncbi:ABC transporter ATP-binding protein [Aquabacter cavernae]|uniref:ABC transporter ATP-binding protein n=1 Tax=Aquabacter cavernae TaxID=2496029 RepID=UPI000F8DB1A6|nr:sn-glycerol-3-phosphate ABC transporter ATP-binding protein UgpC [Aquabacter cavernae]
MSARLELSGLAKDFGRTRVLAGIDLTVEPGEMLVIVGASGCGKSTLLRLVAGLEAGGAGRVLLDGRDITGLDPAARDMAMVFQNYALYPHMSVFDNMAYGLRIRGLSRAELQARVAATAELLGLSALLDRKPRQLSGGQRQRVAMGRAIVREPRLFLFDEPLSNLDATLRLAMRVEIRRLQKRLGTTSLYVTHDQTEAMTLGDRLLVMHEGKPVQLAPPLEVYHRPANTYVAGFIGAPPMNFLPATLAGDGSAACLEGGHVLAFADGRRAGGEGRALTLGIRPEHVEVVAEGLPLTVDLAEPLGAETILIGRLPDGRLLSVRVPGEMPVPERLHVRLPARHLHVFDAASGLRLEPI